MTSTVYCFNSIVIIINVTSHCSTQFTSIVANKVPWIESTSWIMSTSCLWVLTDSDTKWKLFLHLGEIYSLCNVFASFQRTNTIKHYVWSMYDEVHTTQQQKCLFSLYENRQNGCMKDLWKKDSNSWKLLVCKCIFLMTINHWT